MTQELLPHIGPVQRVLISVYDKDGLVELGQALRSLGVEILASGGTYQTLAAVGLAVTPVEVFTQAPETLDGRVKTLHPKIYAGLLADRRNATHLAQLSERGYVPIDLVVCNLYPFAELLQRGAADAQLIEQIDIGGVSLLRAGAKNADGGVTVVADAADYTMVVAALRQHGGVAPGLRRRLAARAFRLVADYDAAIAAWMGQYAAEPAAPFPARLGDFVRGPALRYGENPHQAAYLYRDEPNTAGVAGGLQLAGKPLSYNNYLDLDAAYRAVFDLPEAACAIVKHTNPCGLSCADSSVAAFQHALAADPLAAYGSVLAFNRPLDGATACALLESKLFVECIVAPAFTEEACDLLRGRENLRLVLTPPGHPAPPTSCHRIGGGLLVQAVDPGPLRSPIPWQVVTRRGLEPGWAAELRFAMHAAWTLKSNAIAVVKQRCLLGAGAGLMSRIDAAELAIKKAGARCPGAFFGSDAFLPFPDCVELAQRAGIVAIIQPGGSIRDEQCIAACNEYGLAMVFTGQRHFRH